jgi:hypothetical protein
LVSPTAGLVELPKELSNLPTNALSDIGGALNKASGAIGGAIGSATGAIGSATGAIGSATGSATGALGVASGALGSITSGLPSVSSLANRGTAELGGLLATASKFGVDNAVSWAKGTAGAAGTAIGAAGSQFGGAINRLANAGLPKGGVPELKTQMDSLAKQGQFAVNFSDFKLPAAVAGIVPAAGFKGTIDRSTLNAATSKLIGSNKIPLPNFSPQAVDTSALTDAASKAKSALSGGLDAQGLLSKATGGIPGAGAIAGLTGGLTVANIDSKINALGDPNAPPYTGDDPIIRSRLGLPPVRAA